MTEKDKPPRAPSKKNAKGKLALEPNRKLAIAIYKTAVPTSTWTQDEAEKFFKQFPEVVKVKRTQIGDPNPTEWRKDKLTGEVTAHAAFEEPTK